MVAQSTTVLVKVETASGMRNRPRYFPRRERGVKYRYKRKFNDTLSKDGDVYLQILDQTWGDVNNVTPGFISPAQVLQRPLIHFIVLNVLILDHNTVFFIFYYHYNS